MILGEKLQLSMYSLWFRGASRIIIILDAVYWFGIQAETKKIRKIYYVRDDICSSGTSRFSHDYIDPCTL